MEELKTSVQHKRDIHGNVVTKEKEVAKKRNMTKILAMTAGAFALMFILTAVLLSVSNARINTLANRLENTYQRAFYDLLGNVSNLEVDLDKVLISGDVDMQKSLLSDIYMESRQASDNLAALPIQHESIADAIAYINRVGAYSNALRKSELTEGDLESLTRLHDNILEIQFKLNGLAQNVYGKYRILDHIDNKQARANLGAAFQQMDSNSIEYPKLTYDGPFSESLVKNVKSISNKMVSLGDALQKLKNNSKALGIKNICHNGDITERVQKYTFSADSVNGDNGAVFITVLKDNGFIDSMTVIRNGSMTEAEIIDSKSATNKLKSSKSSVTELTDEQCIAVAEKFLYDLGLDDMKAVWIMDFNGTAYINLAPVVNGVIVYPDIVKVKVARDNGQILGLEGMSYAYNHTNRNISTKDVINAQDIDSKVNKSLEIKSKSLCIAPKDHIGEVLAYQVECTNGGERYFLYIDAINGNEIEIMKVIDANEGRLLL